MNVLQLLDRRPASNQLASTLVETLVVPVRRQLGFHHDDYFPNRAVERHALNLMNDAT